MEQDKASIIPLRSTLAPPRPPLGANSWAPLSPVIIGPHKFPLLSCESWEFLSSVLETYNFSCSPFLGICKLNNLDRYCTKYASTECQYPGSQCRYTQIFRSSTSSCTLFKASFIMHSALALLLFVYFCMYISLWKEHDSKCGIC